MKWKTDWGLEARMLFTMVMLGAVYLAFLAFLYRYTGISTLGMVIIAGGLLLLQYFYSDRLVLWSTGAREVSESEAPELHAMVTRLCAIANLPKPRIAIVSTSAPNAFATGRSQKASVVAMTSGIISQLDRDELEAVLAHELTHVKNRDAAIMTIASFLSTIAFFLVRNFLLFGGAYDRRSKDSGGSIIVVWMISLLVWILSFILIRALSRYREFAADRGSAIITGRPSHLSSALMKISEITPRIPAQDLRRVEVSNNLNIVPALSGQSVFNIFSTHPSTEARIAALEKISQEMEA
jgi:heat shock protein HtpX